MKALVLEEYNKLVYRDWPDPVLADNEVLVRVRAAAICGSDVHGMDGSTGRRIPPLIMGHEASGIIEETGKEVRNLKEGDRVTFDSTIYSPCDWYSLKGLYNLSDNRMVLGVSTGEYRRHGAFAEYLNVPEHILYRLPDDVSYTQAAMVEPLAVAAHAAGLASPAWNDSVAVIGCGMIGLSLIQVLRSMGCGKIFAVDIDPFKLGLALRLGADHAIDPLSPEATIPLQSVVTRQIRLQGSCAICGEFPAVLDMIARGAINTDPLISAEAPLSEGAEWFRRLYAREPGLLKVVLHP